MASRTSEERVAGGGNGGGERRWTVQASRESHDSINPIRQFEETRFQDVLSNSRNRTDLEFIKLSIGDTTALPVHPVVPEAVRQVLDSGGMCGYSHSCGLDVARQAIAELYSPYTNDQNGINAKNVIMTSACSGALEMCVTVLTNPGQNILIPSPGFGLYTCLSAARGLDCRLYRLKPELSWEVDLEDLESKIDSNTAALILNNPSNPCGSCYSRQHLCDILVMAERHKLPIIADETYAWMEFPGEEFHMLSSLSHSVPILSCSSLAKRWVVPGWRQGWIVIHDRHDAFKDEVTPGLKRLATKILGPNTLVQAAIPDIVTKVPMEYHQKNLRLFHSNATHIVTALSAAHGLTPIMPKATMYCMVLIQLDHFPDLETDVAFTRALIVEQNVFCLPGPAFNTSACFRIVLACGEDRIQEACRRITTFCKKHYRA